MSGHTLSLHQPATRWEDALPCGNGRIGAMLYGSIQKERILLNHENLWLPLFGRPKLPAMARHLPRYRKLLEQYKFTEADAYYRRMLKKEGWPDCIYTEPFHPAFDFCIESRVDGAFTGYRRGLALGTGEASVAWKEHGKAFARRMFVSRADDVVVIELTAGVKGGLEFSAGFGVHPMHETMRKQLCYPRDFSWDEIPLKFMSGARGSHAAMRVRYTRGGGGYGGVARIATTGGTVRASEDRLEVKGATRALILIGISGTRMTPAVERREKARLNKLPARYDTLLKRHARMHGAYLERVSLHLEDVSGRVASNEALLRDAYENRASNSLVERLFDYGRYLFISSTGTTGMPPNLQGLWNGDYVPAWSSDYTNDENVQMMHWHVLPSNLPELLGPYFDYYEASVRPWRKNAKAFFGCRGVYACLRQSNHGLMAENMPYMIWSEGAGWLARQFYEYWQYTGDRTFLRERAIPFLKEVALFYEDFLYEDARGRCLICPTMSPENIPDFPGAGRTTINPTMAIAVIREVLTSLIEACELLGTERRGVARWKDMLGKLPPYKVNSDGAIREWVYPRLKDNYHHRHLSHVYPLFPGNEVTPESDPALYKACKIAVEKRLVVGIQSQTGWSLAHMAHIYARLGDGDRALECIDLLARSCLGPNLLTYHNDYRHQGITLYENAYPPFQMDANLGITSAVIEMLVFSLPGFVKVLPALPRRWTRGAVEGIACKGGATVSLKWDRAKKTVAVSLTSRARQTITVKAPGWAGRVRARTAGVSVRPAARGAAYWDITVPARRSVSLTFSGKT
ncbi:MAG: glycoside hydrolase family 95 protein [Chitinivibrionales bacterium]|nr:glycoside hydrolase family 95 protein [Chitinivibrionales bacterium]MBD3394171.1 glycoside hydrolase family 95 protein [Chitinivibrionales bacterium]